MKFSGFTTAMLARPFEGADDITPSDTKPISRTRALYIGIGGDLAVAMADHSKAKFIGIKSGAVLPLRVQAVLASGTTATGIVALY